MELPKGVHRVESRGKEFYYFQAGRGTKAAGPRILAPRQAQGANHLEVSPHTVAGAIDGYLASVADSISDETLYNCRRYLETARKAWGGLPITGVRPAHVLAVMNGLASTPGKARNFLAAMKQLSGWAITQDLIDKSMVDGVKSPKQKSGHRPWTQERIAAGERCLIGVVRQGFLLYLYTGQRGSDIVKLGPTHVDEGGFNLKQVKTGREAWCPILPELAVEMTTWPRRPGPYLLQDSGASYTRNLFWDHFDQAREKVPELAGVASTACAARQSSGSAMPGYRCLRSAISWACLWRPCNATAASLTARKAAELLS